MHEENLGMCGKMGRIIALYQLYQKTDEEEWEKMAVKLLDEVLSSCNGSLSLSYKYGLLGVGIGLEWLFQNGFLNGERDEVLSDFDILATTAIIKRMIPKAEDVDGLLGLTCYFYYRLHYRKNEETLIVLKLKEHVLYLIDWVIEKVQCTKLEEDIYIYYFMFVLLHQLNVCNAKIINIMSWCNNKIKEIDINKDATNKYYNTITGGL